MALFPAAHSSLLGQDSDDTNVSSKVAGRHGGGCWAPWGLPESMRSLSAGCVLGTADPRALSGLCSSLTWDLFFKLRLVQVPRGLRRREGGEQVGDTALAHRDSPRRVPPIVAWWITPPPLVAVNPRACGHPPPGSHEP